MKTMRKETILRSAKQIDRFEWILGIDPGPDSHSCVLLKVKFPDSLNSPPTFTIFRVASDVRKPELILSTFPEATYIALEKFVSYGRPIGDSSIRTIEACGAILHLLEVGRPEAVVTRPSRSEIKLALLGKTTGTDSEIREALMEFYGRPGTKKAQGPTYGMKSHDWAALAVAHLYATELLEVRHTALVSFKRRAWKA